jgi:hypothetical protein
MSYQDALEAAGAKVLQFEQFGSYQGEWFALVEFNGETGWVNGSYGSCSGCDSFEAEFGWDEEYCSEHRWVSNKPACADCDKAKADHAAKLADFGKTYLGTMLTQAQAEEQAAKYADWDSDAAEMVAYIKANAIQGADR